MEVLDIEDHGVVPLPPTAGNYDREVHVRREQPAGVHRVPRRRQAHRDHPARRARASPSTAGRCSGRSGRCGSASTRAKASPCTRSPTPTAARTRPDHVPGDRCRRWWCPTAIPAPTHWNKNVFDMGEVGMGFSANPLTLGLRLPGRDPLLRRHGQRLGRQRRHHPERDLHARGGLRNLVEAHRLPHR